jgi:hypothetical protein
VLPEPAQKVTLVLAGVQTFQQPVVCAVMMKSRIMTCRNAVSAQFQRVFEKCVELDLLIAHDVWVGRAPGPVFPQKVGKYPVPVLLREVYLVQRDFQGIACLQRVLKILLCSAVSDIVGFLPVFHEQSFDSVALLQQ